ncbi:TetR/AcrR family transcriptional regulator [Chitinivorax sp. B]|uniref:TetR/AcrR family transcriptional regulator n=1 Tax=Chitinivorax sp. B TaxID=2502235 RepID=UPI0010F7F377|nr:TetR/AcrR family transcriptional regulator [Chitinivorax sp. B]
MTDIPKPRKAPRQQRSQQTVEIILQATARIFAEKGYAGTNTNLVAEHAGVSVGSIYQYFPNKDALVAALHDRHAAQMYQVIDVVLSATGKTTLQEHVAGMVRAMLAAHLIEPALHRMLEREFPFFDEPATESKTDQSIFMRVRRLLSDWREQVVPDNLDLATWVVLRMLESMVHAAVIDPPDFPMDAIERAIVDAVMGYLTGRVGNAPVHVLKGSG